MLSEGVVTMTGETTKALLGWFIQMVLWNVGFYSRSRCFTQAASTALVFSFAVVHLAESRSISYSFRRRLVEFSPKPSLSQGTSTCFKPSSVPAWVECNAVILALKICMGITYNLQYLNNKNKWHNSSEGYYCLLGVSIHTTMNMVALV